MYYDLVVCFISPRQRLGDMKHTTRFIIHRMEWKFIWDPILCYMSSLILIYIKKNCTKNYYLPVLESKNLIQLIKFQIDQFNNSHTYHHCAVIRACFMIWILIITAQHPSGDQCYTDIERRCDGADSSHVTGIRGVRVIMWPIRRRLIGGIYSKWQNCLKSTLSC